MSDELNSPATFKLFEHPWRVCFNNGQDIEVQAASESEALHRARTVAAMVRTSIHDEPATDAYTVFNLDEYPDSEVES